MLSSVMQGPPRSILFVCMGNICRSPAAENMLRHLAREAGLLDQLRIDSAGTINYHEGNPPDPRMCRTLHARGIPTDGKARQVQARDLAEFDLVLAADRENLRDLLHLEGADAYRDKIAMITDFCQTQDLDEVPDPYYGGTEGFEKVADLLEDACQGLIEKIQNA